MLLFKHSSPLCARLLMRESKVMQAFARDFYIGESDNKKPKKEPSMKEKVDRDIGRVVGFEVGEFMYIATIIAIDDEAEQFTVCTEDGQELTGPFGAVFLDPHDRMGELQDDYESLGNGKFRAKQRKARSNWVPVKDPSLQAILRTSGSIIGVTFAIGVAITLISIGAILTQIDSENWLETEGSVAEAYNGQDCSTDSEGTTSCTTYTAVTVAYTYEGRNYTTDHYSMLSNDWLKGAQYWNEVDSVAVYVNPEQPSQAVHLQGWDGVLEEAFTLVFFTGIILGAYLFVGVPAWFVYAKIQRFSGIEAPEKKKEESYERSSWEADNDQTEQEKDIEAKATDIKPDESEETEEPTDEKFW